MGTLKPADKIVDIHLNGVYLEHLRMKLGSAGEAYFIETVEESSNESFDSSLAVSPFHSDSEDVEDIDKTDLSASRLPSKKRGRRNVRAKTELYVKSALEEISQSEEQICYQNQYHCLSDNDDFTQDDNLELVREGYHSDGAVDQITKEELVDINMTWDWGNFPADSSNAVKEDPPKEDQPKEDQSKEDKPKEDKPKEPPKVVVNTEEPVFDSESKRPSKEIYLEDIMGNDVSDELKRTYLYTEDVKTTKTHHESVGGVGCFDAGYRSDGEASVSAASPTYPIIHELKLSLCGDINIKEKISEESFFHYLVSFEDFIKDPDELLKNPNLVVLLNGEYYNWSVAAPLLLSIIAFQTELPIGTVGTLKSTYMSQKKRRSPWFPWRRQEQEKEKESPKAETTTTKQLEAAPPHDDVTTGNDNATATAPNKFYKKKIRLSSKEVAALNLHEGRNDITFSMTTKYQGTTCCQATIYRWKWHDKIVISDVDGTITKSDVLGHVLPILGRDWTQAGVAKLYHKIGQNNYRFIYLSARAIGQAAITRSLLTDIVQESSDRLPPGPVLLSPTSLFQSLHREVIEKKPEVFKIQCLNDVKSLFPEGAHPLYAGFGNRVNDVIAYKAVGVDPRRIFTVNPEGSLKNEYCQRWSTSYGNLFDVADHFFQFRRPVVAAALSGAARRRSRSGSGSGGSANVLEDYHDVNYWARPIDERELRQEINKAKCVK